MNRRIRVLVVDDHALVRDGLVRLMAQTGVIDPVGEAATGPEAVELAMGLQPDVALVDLRMPDMDGIETALRLQEICPDIRVLILTGVENQRDLVRALSAGLYGYIPKGLPFAAVVRSIELACVGGVTFPRKLSQGIFSKRVSRVDVNAVDSVTPSLTDRERQILWGLTRGESNRQIADRLVISEHTVRAHLRNLMRKLGANNRAQAAGVAPAILGNESLGAVDIGVPASADLQ